MEDLLNKITKNCINCQLALHNCIIKMANFNLKSIVIKYLKNMLIRLPFDFQNLTLFFLYHLYLDKFSLF